MEPSEQKYRQQIKIIFFIAILIWAVVYYKQKQEIEKLGNQVNKLENSLSNYRDALEEANNNIEEANSQIEDAQGYAEESYEDMSYVLENLTTVETVSAPY